MDLFSFITAHWLLSLVIIVLAATALYDVLQKKYTIKHNFPLLGHIRYWGEMIGPELRQYWVAHDREEKPFDRAERTWIYCSAKGIVNIVPFGTAEQLYRPGYPIIKHSAFPYHSEHNTFDPEDPTRIPCLKTMGEFHGRKRPYSPESVVNISAMSFGALGARAITALNRGAAMARCYHNTGEGGVSPYHLEGGDIVLQLGTGYFGARDGDGRFSMERLVESVSHPEVKAIEIKLSQGAKAGKGGLLPGRKVTAELAAVRGVPAGVDCVSPSYHSEFGNTTELIDFIERVAEATGLPVGIKSAVGSLDFWEELATLMADRREGPDFIAIDGGEGGTGAAPLVFSDHVALPFRVGFPRVYKVFQSHGISERVVWIGSARLGLPEYAVLAFTMGCDLIQIAREAMMAIGCIQSKRCHTNHCPTGVATQNRWLQAGLDVDDKARRFSRFTRNLRREILNITYAAGYKHPCQFTGSDIEFSTGVNEFTSFEAIMGYERDGVELGPYESH